MTNRFLFAIILKYVITYDYHDLESCENSEYHSIVMVAPEGGIGMSEVRVGKNESLDSALRRFKRSCQKAGVMADIRRHEHYEKPSVRRKKKSEAARKRKWK